MVGVFVRGRWYFSITALSGMFAVTFSIVFAYVADITTKEDRSAAYGLVCSIMSSCIDDIFSVVLSLLAAVPLYFQFLLCSAMLQCNVGIGGMCVRPSVCHTLVLIQN